MKLERAITHVIFDLDGVLLDTEPLYTQATQEVVAPYGKVFDWSIKRDMIGRSALESARHLVTALALPIAPEEYLARRRPLLERLFLESREMPGAPGFVRELQSRGVPLAIATSSERSLYEQKTRHHAWFSCFDAVVCGDDPRVRTLKPAPDIFLVAASELAAKPERCLVLEDSPAGVEAARAAGMQVIALPDPNLGRDAFAGATYIAAGYAELALADLGL